MSWKDEFQTDQGVYRKAKADSKFEALYLKIREKEKRLLEDQMVLNLPHLPLGHGHHNEWKKRADTLERFGKYLKQHSFKVALEIGCGNGWFSNWLANQIPTCIGQDINLTELQQAARVFKRSNLDFVDTNDILELSRLIMPDLVVFNASLQYFDPKDKLLESLMKTLGKNAEVHILDSPVYANEVEAQMAMERSAAYYSNKEVPELSNYYFHYTQASINGEQLYRPAGRIKKLMKPDGSPFPWFRLINKNEVHA